MRFCFVILVIFCLVSCKKNICFHSEEEMVEWLNNPSNGFVKQKAINGFVISVKYLPSWYLAYREIKNSDNMKPDSYDSLVTYYNRSMSFSLGISPDTTLKNTGDVMLFGVKNLNDYTSKFNDLNFNLESYIELKKGKNSTYPILWNLENTYGLTNYRTINLVFNKDSSIAKTTEFIFKDMFFDTGVSTYEFETSLIDIVPTIEIAKIIDINKKL